MEQDVVCQMTVDPKTAPAREYEGRTYYFCCEGCAREFSAHPEKYVRTDA